MEFYERIKLFRKEKGLSQSKLSIAAGLSTPYISQVETGKKSPSVRTLEAIASALNVPVAKFFGCDC